MAEQFTITFSGAAEHDQHVFLDNFAATLRDLHKTLAKTDHFFSGANRRAVDFLVVDLKHRSPAAVTVGVIPKKPGDPTPDLVVKSFCNGMRIALTGEPPPPFHALKLQPEYDALARSFAEQFAETKVIYNSHVVTLRPEHFPGRPDENLTETTVCSVEGQLDYVRLHKGIVFRVYSDLFPPVECKLPEHRINEAVDAWKKQVLVTGQARLDAKGYPTQMDVQEFEVFPGQDALPDMEELLGVAPEATGDLSAHEFLHEFRMSEDEG